MISIFDWCTALNNIVKADPVLQSLDVKGAFYQLAPTGTTGEFVVHQMQNGSFDRTLGGVIDVDLSWQICAVAGDRDGESPMQRVDAMVQRLWQMFEEGEDLISAEIASLGYECEVSRGTGFVPPRLQLLGGAQKWRYGHIYQFMLQPLG